MSYIQSLKKLLDYDPETGVFTWKISRGCGVSAVKAGSRAGYKNWCGHRIIGVAGQKHREHRLAFEFCIGPIPKGFEIDHVNGLYDDNRIDNLRLATHQQNLANCKNRKNNTSGRKGVNKWQGRWRAKISIRGKTLHLGMFDTQEEAAAAYLIAAKEHFGEFARAG